MKKIYLIFIVTYLAQQLKADLYAVKLTMITDISMRLAYVNRSAGPERVKFYDDVKPSATGVYPTVQEFTQTGILGTVFDTIDKMISIGMYLVSKYDKMYLTVEVDVRLVEKEPRNSDDNEKKGS